MLEENLAQVEEEIVKMKQKYQQQNQEVDKLQEDKIELE